MSDIMMCNNDKCKMKDSCLRFLATPNKYMQSYIYDAENNCENKNYELYEELEVWEVVSEFESLYEVSNLGKVRSMDRVGSNGRLYKGQMKSLNNNGKGYFQANLKVNGRQTNKYIHRMVAEAFLPNPDNKPEVNHKDGDKSNNHVDNLEWVTRIENVKHSWEKGLSRSYERSEEWRMKSGKNRKGKFAGGKNPRAIAVVQLDKNTGDFIAEYDCAKDGARAFGRENCGNIINCCKNKINSIYGYKWMYKSEWEESELDKI